MTNCFSDYKFVRVLDLLVEKRGKQTIFLPPHYLKSTLFSPIPVLDHILPYDSQKDPGIKVGIDPEGNYWILDGHHRVAAAGLTGVPVKVGEVTLVCSKEMWQLIDG